MGSEISTGRKRNSHPYDWYVDESWVSSQLYRALGGFQAERDNLELIWDPCAGSGRTIATFVEQGHLVLASDIVNRLDPELFEHGLPPFKSLDFLTEKYRPAPCSVVCNPPYNYIPGIAEAFVRKALQLATRRVCMVLPTKWQGSQGRFALFALDHPPEAVLVLSQRPSMPPGDLLPALERAGRAFRGGVVDYAWFVWNVQRPTPRNQTRTVWLPPLHQPELLLPIEELC